MFKTSNKNQQKTVNKLPKYSRKQQNKFASSVWIKLIWTFKVVEYETLMINFQKIKSF